MVSTEFSLGEGSKNTPVDTDNGVGVEQKDETFSDNAITLADFFFPLLLLPIFAFDSDGEFVAVRTSIAALLLCYFMVNNCLDSKTMCAPCCEK